MFEKTDETKCPNCIFFRGKGPAAGRCHRFPPNVDGKVPPVPPINWCGEFVVRPKKEEAAPEPEAQPVEAEQSAAPEPSAEEKAVEEEG